MDGVRDENGSNGGGGGRGGKRGYHHGNLPEALVRAALPLIAARGPQGFTMAEVAREAGVSNAAPYRHFKGREELIAEIARRGFDLFADLLDRAWANGEPSPLAAFENVGRAYLAFARKEPGYYIAMFESGVPQDDPALRAASERAMTALRRAVEKLAERLPPGRRPPIQMMTYHIWAMAHGVVELFARQSAGQRASISPEDLLEAGALVYLRGLGLIPSDD